MLFAIFASTIISSLYVCARPVIETDTTASSLRTSVRLPIVATAIDKFTVGERRHDLERVLKATYYYNCPTAGQQWRSFQWYAHWYSQTQMLAVGGLVHIQEIKDIGSQTPDFWATWEGSFCAARPGLLCSYVFTGRTEGTATLQGIAMSLVMESSVEEELPTVHEICLSTSSLQPETCPLLPMTGNRKCNINHIDVSVVHHPRSHLAATTATASKKQI